jgi:hypothetical protein
MDHGDYVVLLALADHANDAGGECWPSVKAIATEMRIGKRSVIRSLNKLASDGWIEVMRKSRDRRANSYQVIMAKLSISDATLTPNLDTTLTPEIPELDATPTPNAANAARDRCQPRQRKVPTATEKGAKCDTNRCQTCFP